MRLFVLALILSACTHAPATNYAIGVVKIVDKDAQCVELRHSAGPELADSALCNSHGSVVFVSVSAADLVTKTVVQAPSAPATEQRPSPTGSPPTSASATSTTAPSIDHSPASTARAADATPPATAPPSKDSK